jgi:hypothetical protein
VHVRLAWAGVAARLSFFVCVGKNSVRFAEAKCRHEREQQRPTADFLFKNFHVAKVTRGVGFSFFFEKCVPN